MKTLLALIGLVAVFFILTRYIFPKLGIKG